MGEEFKENEVEFDWSWLPVFIMLCVFWPVGLYMLFKKLKETQAAPKKQRRRSISAIGIGLLALGGIQVLGKSIPFGAFALLGGAATLFFGGKLKERDKRFKKYKSIIGVRSVVKIDEIAAAMPVSHEKACQDLQTMIDEGMLGKHAYLDMDLDCYILNSAYAPAKPVRKAKPAPAPQAPAEPVAPAPAAKQKEGKAPKDSYEAKIEEIMRLNEAIADEKVSAQIVRVENATRGIFNLVRERPDKLSQINTFMNYYLPTTLKLLRAYSQLEKQTVSGANITASRQNIERMMDQLVWAFEQQLDNLFEADAMDISSDISVLEKMMAKDGLTDGAYTLPKMAQGGAAAQQAQSK